MKILSPEKEIFELFAQGNSVIQVGKTLGISKYVVNRRASRFREKYDLKNNTHACVELVKNNLIL